MMLNKTSFSMFLLLLTSLVCYASSMVLVSNALNTISLMVLVVFAIVWFLSVKETWVTFIYLFGFVFAALSGYLVELRELYMFEIVESGHLSGASASTTSLMVVFLVISCVTCRLVSNSKFTVARVKGLDGLLLRVLIVVAFSLPVFLLVVIFVYGSPLFMGVDRFSYWAEVAPPGVGKVRYFLVFMSFVVAYAYCTKVLRGGLAFLWLFLSCLALVLNGEKLSGFVVLLYFYMIPYFVFGAKNISLQKFLAVSGVVGGLLFFVVVANYFLIQGDVESTLNLFLARLAVQGQMNYAVFNASHGGALSEVIKGYVGLGAGEYETGIYYLMYLIAPVDIVERRISQGTTFTIPFPANNIYFFGWYISLLVTMITAVLVGFVAGVVLVSLKSKNFLLSLVSVALFYYLYGAVVMGNMNKIFEWKFVLMILVLVAMMMMGCRASKSTQI